MKSHISENKFYDKNWAKFGSKTKDDNRTKGENSTKEFEKILSMMRIGLKLKKGLKKMRSIGSMIRIGLKLRIGLHNLKKIRFTFMDFLLHHTKFFFVDNCSSIKKR